MKSQLICLLLIIALFSLSCEKKDQNNSNDNTIEITDYFGRSLTIQRNINRVIPLYYVQAENICILGGSEKIVGIGRLMKEQSPIIHKYFPHLYEIPQVGNQNNVDYEKIVSLKPDLIFCGLEKNTVERLDELNIQNISTYPKSPLEVSNGLLLYGKLINKSENAEKIVKFLNNIYFTVMEIISKIDSLSYPRVYYARTDPLTTLGSGLNSEVIKIVGGINVAKSFENDVNGTTVSIEDIYKWNPDIIIIRDRASFNPDFIYNDEKWSKLNAVKKKQVYQETFGWTEFRVGMFFGLMEKAKWLHPEEFKGLDPQLEYNKFVKLFLSFQ